MNAMLRLILPLPRHFNWEEAKAIGNPNRRKAVFQAEVKSRLQKQMSARQQPRLALML